MNVQDTNLLNASLSPREQALLRKRHALHRKYEKAVGLYADTDMTLKDIAKECAVPLGGLGNYLRRYWRASTRTPSIRMPWRPVTRGTT